MPSNPIAAVQAVVLLSLISMGIFILGYINHELNHKPNNNDSENSNEFSIKLSDLESNVEFLTLKSVESDYEIISGYSSYQNRLGNWRGKGTYRGVLLSDIIETMGGISFGDLIKVTAADEYYQFYNYDNCYPTGDWKIIQGDIILAYEYNGTRVPNWVDGFQIIMLPEDGAYSNEDLNSSNPIEFHGQSAGARWVRNVASIEIIETNQLNTLYSASIHGMENN